MTQIETLSLEATTGQVAKEIAKFRLASEAAHDASALNLQSDDDATTEELIDTAVDEIIDDRISYRKLGLSMTFRQLAFTAMFDALPPRSSFLIKTADKLEMEQLIGGHPTINLRHRISRDQSEADRKDTVRNSAIAFSFKRLGILRPKDGSTVTHEWKPLAALAVDYLTGNPENERYVAMEPYGQEIADLTRKYFDKIKPQKIVYKSRFESDYSRIGELDQKNLQIYGTFRKPMFAHDIFWFSLQNRFKQMK